MPSTDLWLLTQVTEAAILVGLFSILDKTFFLCSFGFQCPQQSSFLRILISSQAQTLERNTDNNDFMLFSGLTTNKNLEASLRSSQFLLEYVFFHYVLWHYAATDCSQATIQYISRIWIPILKPNSTA